MAEAVPYPSWWSAFRHPGPLAAAAVFLLPLVVGWFLDRFHVLSDRWLVEQSAQRYLWMAGVGVMALAGYFVVAGWRLNTGVLFALGLSAAGGFYLGPQLMIAANCVGAGGPPQVTEARYQSIRERSPRAGGDLIRFETSAPAAKFVASLKKWNEGGGKIEEPRPVQLRRGRLGLLWVGSVLKSRGPSRQSAHRA